MIVTDDFRADIQEEVRGLSDRKLVNEYNVFFHILDTKGIDESINIDLYLEAMEVLRDEMCRRFCEVYALEK